MGKGIAKGVSVYRPIPKKFSTYERPILPTMRPTVLYETLILTMYEAINETNYEK